MKKSSSRLDRLTILIRAHRTITRRQPDFSTLDPDGWIDCGGDVWISGGDKGMDGSASISHKQSTDGLTTEKREAGCMCGVCVRGMDQYQSITIKGTVEDLLFPFLLIGACLSLLSLSQHQPSLPYFLPITCKTNHSATRIPSSFLLSPS